MKLLLLVLFLGFRVSAKSPPNEVTPTPICDFDINLDEYLSDACKKLKSEGGELFKKAEEETILFNKFYEKLREFEDKFDKSDFENNDMWNARTELYNKTLLHECHRNKTGVALYGWLIKKREKMIVELDKLIAKKIPHNS